MLIAVAGVVFAGLPGRILPENVDSRTLPIKISLSVVDEQGRMRSGLKASDLRVSLKGENIAPGDEGSRNDGTFFSLSEATGIAAPESFSVLVFDVSRRSRNALKRTKETANRFVSELGANDQVMIVSFGQRVNREREFTRDRKQAMASISALSATQKGTRLWDGVYEALNSLASYPSKRRSVFVFSDGLDTGSTMQVRDCIARAEGEQIPIMSILLASSKIRAETLTRLADFSGGSSLQLADRARSTDVASALVARLHPAYTMTVMHPSFKEGGSFELKVESASASASAIVAIDTIRILPPKPQEAPSIRWPYLMVAALAVLVIGLGWLIVKRRSEPNALTEAPVTERSDEEVRASTLRKSMRHMEEMAQQLASASQNLPKELSGYEHEVRHLEDTVANLVRKLLEMKDTTQDMVDCIERNEADAEATQVHVLWTRDNLDALFRSNDQFSRVPIKVGDTYDVTQHEQIGMVPPGNNHRTDTIAEVVREGWIIRLPDFQVTIRPKVIVAKAKEGM
jgi:molecular chaperone GrpE (heat shock protein)